MPENSNLRIHAIRAISILSPELSQVLSPALSPFLDAREGELVMVGFPTTIDIKGRLTFDHEYPFLETIVSRNGRLTAADDSHISPGQYGRVLQAMQMVRRNPWIMGPSAEASSVLSRMIATRNFRPHMTSWVSSEVNTAGCWNSDGDELMVVAHDFEHDETHAIEKLKRNLHHIVTTASISRAQIRAQRS